jgi:hypothetical protein
MLIYLRSYESFGFFGIYVTLGLLIAVPVLGIFLLRQYYKLSKGVVPLSALRMVAPPSTEGVGDAAGNGVGNVVGSAIQATK